MDTCTTLCCLSQKNKERVPASPYSCARRCWNVSRFTRGKIPFRPSETGDASLMNFQTLQVVFKHLALSFCAPDYFRLSLCECRQEENAKRSNPPVTNICLLPADYSLYSQISPSEISIGRKVVLIPFLSVSRLSCAEATTVVGSVHPVAVTFFAFCKVAFPYR